MNVHLSQHAVTRYIERVRPGLDFPAAKIELRTLIDSHGQQREPPQSFTGRGADAWVSIGDDVWLACGLIGGRLVALSVLCRGHEREGRGRPRRLAKRVHHAAYREAHDLQDRTMGRHVRPEKTNGRAVTSGAAEDDER